jgi:hypothetical protein
MRAINWNYFTGADPGKNLEGTFFLFTNFFEQSQEKQAEAPATDFSADEDCHIPDEDEEGYGLEH